MAMYEHSKSVWLIMQACKGCTGEQEDELHNVFHYR